MSLGLANVGRSPTRKWAMRTPTESEAAHSRPNLCSYAAYEILIEVLNVIISRTCSLMKSEFQASSTLRAFIRVLFVVLLNFAVDLENDLKYIQSLGNMSNMSILSIHVYSS